MHAHFSLTPSRLSPQLQSFPTQKIMNGAITMKMGTFGIHFMMLILMTKVSPFNAQAEVNTTNCANVKYCPDWSYSCIEEYIRNGGPANFSAFNAAYSCCVCDTTNERNCMCAKRGNITRFFVDVSNLEPPGAIPVGAGGLFIKRGRLDGKRKKRFADCVFTSDCVDIDSCRAKCMATNVTYMRKHYKCCVCEPPKSDCRNCFCAKGNFLEVKITKNATKGGKQIGDFVTLVLPRTLTDIPPLLFTNPIQSIINAIKNAFTG